MLTSGMGHEVQDQVSFELARRVAEGLPKHPEWIELARTNLDRCGSRNAKHRHSQTLSVRAAAF
jgi:hypothetical protein